MQGLGRLYDFSCSASPVDLTTAGTTGKRVSLRDCEGVAIVLFLGAAASGAEAVVGTIQQHTTASGGTSQTLSGADANIRVSTKLAAATALVGTETWGAVSNPSAGVVTVAGANATKEAIVVIEIDAVSLSDGFNYVSLNIADPGTVSRLAGVLYVQRDLKVQRKAANLRASLN